jgi:hypothetical protein
VTWGGHESFDNTIVQLFASNVSVLMSCVGRIQSGILTISKAELYMPEAGSCI